MVCFHLFVDFDDHHGFDAGQQFRQDQRWHAQRLTKFQRRAYIPTDHSTRSDAQLATQTADQIPDLPAFVGAGAVQPRGAVRAGPFTGFAVARAPAEFPLGKGAEAFFSCSSSRPLET